MPMSVNWACRFLTDERAAMHGLEQFLAVVEGFAPPPGTSKTTWIFSARREPILSLSASRLKLPSVEENEASRANLSRCFSMTFWGVGKKKSQDQRTRASQAGQQNQTNDQLHVTSLFWRRCAGHAAYWFPLNKTRPTICERLATPCSCWAGGMERLSPTK